MGTCKNANIPKPEFKYDGSGLWTTFYFSKEYQEGTFGTNQKTTQENQFRRTELQQSIMEYLKANPSAMRNKLVENIPNVSTRALVRIAFNC